MLLQSSCPGRAIGRCFQSRGPAPRVVVAQAANKRAVASDAPAPPLTRPKPASAAQQAQAQAVAPPSQGATPPAIAEAYTRAAEAKALGKSVEVKVVSQNEGGVMVQYGPLRGFIPYNKLDPARLRASTSGDLSSLLGQQLKARVVTADAARKELILSERLVAAAEALARLQPGDVVAGVVSGVEDYGAFIQVKDMPEVSGLVHKSEVSWERIMTVEAVVAIGQEVRAKVLSVDPANCRLTLSIRQTTADPLRSSLDELPWAEVEGGAAAAGEEGAWVGSADPQIQGLVRVLTGAIGVKAVEVTRTTQDPHHVAQELELYLIRSDTEGVYMAVARLGTGAIELRISAADLSREQMKQLLQRVAQAAASL